MKWQEYIRKAVRYQSSERRNPAPVSVNKKEDSPSWQKLYSHPLVNLGDSGNSRLEGIFSPIYDQSTLDQYIHGQLDEYARNYAERYHAPEATEKNILQAFEKTERLAQDRKGLTVLDVGVGTGNSTLSLLNLCTDSFIIASDLNVEMLLLLKEALVKCGTNNTYALLQLNAEELDFVPESFDLIVGTGVLHHLLSPDKTLEGCARILKRGGYAIFFEPFENGNAILCIVYRAILSDPRQTEIAEDVRRLFGFLVQDFDLRKGRDKSAPRFHSMEDKWLFTSQYLRELARQYKFSDCLIYPLHPTTCQFEHQTQENLRIGLGKGKGALPDWAWTMVRQYDQFFSEDMKNELPLEAGVMLKKQESNHE